jgi:ABC-type dipeptide/oligopeptide/nickel transport system ATPase subunit
MKKIDKLVLKNFKAFRDQTFEFGGKHILLYGNNGSGKSSLYWALYTFLQSSGKTNDQLQKYFKHFESNDRDTYRSLKNIFADTQDEVLVEMTYIEDDGTKTVKTISPNVTNTIGDNTIQKANLASDFINYKLLQNFYNVTHKQEVNLWEVFWRDVFPYFEEGGKSYREQIDALTIPTGRRQAVRQQFQDDLDNINNGIEAFLGQIETNANSFLKDHFHEGKDVLEVKLEYHAKIDENWVRSKQPTPEIRLYVKLFDNVRNTWIDNYRPQSLLNEAQLTRVALAIRIGALFTRPNTETIDFKVLCLDDLLISLDMSNRRKVVKIILNTENNPSLARFDSYQKIILTHDKAFFNMFKYFTTATEWKYFELQRDENSQHSPKLLPQKSHFERAKEHFEIGNFDDAAIHLRKEIEFVLKSHFNTNLNANTQYKTLSNLINQAKNKISERHRQRFEKFSRTSIENIQRLGTDFESDITLSTEDKQKIRGFKIAFIRLLEEQHNNQDESTWLINHVRQIVDFNLNPNAHDSTTPNYNEEIKEALVIVKRLRDYFESI